MMKAGGTDKIHVTHPGWTEAFHPQQDGSMPMSVTGCHDNATLMKS